MRLKRFADAQLHFIESAAAENRRRAELELGKSTGGAGAVVAASAVLSTGSNQRYIAQLSSGLQQDMAWNLKLASDEARMARLGAASSRIRAVGADTLVGAVSSLILGGPVSR